MASTETIPTPCKYKSLDLLVELSIEKEVEGAELSVEKNVEGVELSLEDEVEGVELSVALFLQQLVHTFLGSYTDQKKTNSRK